LVAKVLEVLNVPQKVASWVKMSFIRPKELKFGTHT
jgi:hypothetical protein